MISDLNFFSVYYFIFSTLKTNKIGFNTLTKPFSASKLDGQSSLDFQTHRMTPVLKYLAKMVTR